MKNIFSFLIIMLFYSTILSQTPVGTYSLGGGLHYPRFIGITSGSISENSNYGAFLSLQRKMSEHMNLRISSDYNHLESNYAKATQSHKVDIISGNLDLLYDLFPCEIFSPYFSGGFGITNFTSKNASSDQLNKNLWGYQMNLGFGVDYKISGSISLKSEAVYRTSSNNKVDGNMTVNDKKGLFRSNGDSYLTLDLGVLWNFSMGDDFAYCEKCPDGIREIYRIDTLIAEVPVEVIKEVIDTVYIERPVLFSVNFDFDKSDLLPEAIPILEYAVQVLEKYKEMKLKISGHTDDRGTEEYNKELSERRARSVYNYLISRGIPENRLTPAGFGEQLGIRENNTDTGRAFNRRVEFQIEESSFTAR